MKLDQHHIYPKSKVKQKGKYPNWIHSPVNILEIEHYKHINELHAPSGNKKGEIARIGCYQFAVQRMYAMVENEYWHLTRKEMLVIKRMYKWCFLDNLNKVNKDNGLIEEYIKILKKIKGQDD